MARPKRIDAPTEVADDAWTWRWVRRFAMATDNAGPDSLHDRIKTEADRLDHKGAPLPGRIAALTAFIESLGYGDALASYMESVRANHARNLAMTNHG